MSWWRSVLRSNAASATAPRCSVNAPGATPQRIPQSGTSFAPVRQPERRGAGRPGEPAGSAEPGDAAEPAAGGCGAPVVGRAGRAGSGAAGTPGSGACGAGSTQPLLGATC